MSGAVLTLAMALITAQGPRAAAKRRKPPAAPVATAQKRVAPPPRTADPAGGGRRADAAGAGAAAADRGDSALGSADAPTTAEGPTKGAKTRVYTFGAMDVEGKLKTPQLLYFLNRVKLELEMSAPDHRSFMKELEKTADDPNL